MDVGNLFELQRAFERDREENAAAEEQKIVGAEQALDDVVVDGAVFENGFELAGDTDQLLDQYARFLARQLLAHLSEIHRQDEQSGELAGERLCRRDADLGTS